MQVRRLVFFAFFVVAIFLDFLLLSSVHEEERLDCRLQHEDGVLVVRARQLHQTFAQRLPQFI